MALNLKRAKNRADEMIEASSSSASFVNELKAMSTAQEPVVSEPIKSEPMKSEPVKQEPVSPEPVTDMNPIVMEEFKPAEPVSSVSGIPEKKTPVRKSGKHRRTKAERGEVCRVQFSSTLEPDLLQAIRDEAKRKHIPLSSFIEMVFIDYFSKKTGF